MNKNLYVGNLSAKVSEDDLKSNFSKAGEVASVTIIRDKFTSQSRGFGLWRWQRKKGQKRPSINSTMECSMDKP